MEAVKSFKRSDFKIDQEDVMTSQILKDLHTTWESLVQHIIGNVQMRWVPTTFPFTDHSAELQIFYQGQWMEILGCGILKRDVMRNYGRPEDEVAWASGAGLERLAINLFEIPDIRLFWSQDERFLNQFQPGKITKFKPFSQFPICYKDVTFWINNLPNFEENDFYEVVRSNGGDLIEKAQCVDTYHDQKSNRTSQCFRIHYRSLEKTLLNSEVQQIQR